MQLELPVPRRGRRLRVPALRARRPGGATAGERGHGPRRNPGAGARGPGVRDRMDGRAIPPGESPRGDAGPGGGRRGRPGPRGDRVRVRFPTVGDVLAGEAIESRAERRPLRLPRGLPRAPPGAGQPRGPPAAGARAAASRAPPLRGDGARRASGARRLPSGQPPGRGRPHLGRPRLGIRPRGFSLRGRGESHAAPRRAVRRRGGHGASLGRLSRSPPTGCAARRSPTSGAIWSSSDRRTSKTRRSGACAWTASGRSSTDVERGRAALSGAARRAAASPSVTGPLLRSAAVHTGAPGST